MVSFTHACKFATSIVQVSFRIVVTTTFARNIPMASSSQRASFKNTVIKCALQHLAICWIKPEAYPSPPLSGFINSPNRFGRPGTKPAVYKVYDPVGELHYEALRYLQGLQPSPAAIAKPITDDMADG